MAPRAHLLRVRLSSSSVSAGSGAPPRSVSRQALATGKPERHRSHPHAAAARPEPCNRAVHLHDGVGYGPAGAGRGQRSVASVRVAYVGALPGEVDHRSNFDAGGAGDLAEVVVLVHDGLELPVAGVGVLAAVDECGIPGRGLDPFVGVPPKGSVTGPTIDMVWFRQPRRLLLLETSPHPCPTAWQAPVPDLRCLRRPRSAEGPASRLPVGRSP